MYCISFSKNELNDTTLVATVISDEQWISICPRPWSYTTWVEPPPELSERWDDDDDDEYEQEGQSAKRVCREWFRGGRNKNHISPRCSKLFSINLLHRLHDSFPGLEWAIHFLSFHPSFLPSIHLSNQPTQTCALISWVCRVSEWLTKLMILSYIRDTLSSSYTRDRDKYGRFLALTQSEQPEILRLLWSQYGPIFERNQVYRWIYCTLGDIIRKAFSFFFV